MEALFLNQKLFKMNLELLLDGVASFQLLAQASDLKDGLKQLVETIQMFSAVLCLVSIVGGAVAYATGNVERSLHLLIASGIFGMAWLITSFFFEIGGAETPF